MTQIGASAYNKLIPVQVGEGSAMQVNVAQLLKEPIGSTRDYEVNGVVAIAGNGTGGTVCGEVRLLRTHRGILVRAGLHTEVEVTCSRCLTPFGYPLDLNIEEEYFPSVDVVSGVPVSVPDEPGGFTIDGQHVLDLTEAVRQYALLAIPMKPLCRPDCAVLYPSYGHNLSWQPSDCPSQPADPRWAALVNLAGEQKGTS